jgi:ribonuclease HI
MASGTDIHGKGVASAGRPSCLLAVALEVQAYACPPWVARSEVVIREDREQVAAFTEDRKPGQVDIYADGSVRNGRAGIGIYVEPSQARIWKTVASSEQADSHLAELLAISEAANWPWDPSCVALDRDGRPTAATSVRVFSDSRSALWSVQSWRASACQQAVAEIVKKLRMSNVTLYWIPGHSGVMGNEEADKLARRATKPWAEEPPQRDGMPWYLVRRALRKGKITAGPLLAGRQTWATSRGRWMRHYIWVGRQNCSSN